MGIHNGDRTHNQDQSILPTNLSVIKTMDKSPQNPIPPYVDCSDELILSAPFV